MRDFRKIARASETVELLRHELNAPVATALLYVGIAESYAARQPGGALTPALRVVRSEIQRLRALIDTLTELQRSGRPAFNPRFLDIGATVRATVKRLLTTFAGTERVTIVGPRHNVHGWWDQTAVEQIVSNLLSNALKFGQGRPIRLIVRAASDGVTIAVRDLGVGIAAADRRQIFERHAHAPVNQGGGTGLGLWLVRELATAHGGHVSVQSRSGRGATFTVLLRTQPPMLGRASNDALSLERLPPQRSPMRTVSSKAASRGALPAYWQERLAKSQLKAASPPRRGIAMAPLTSTLIAPPLTANLKANWPPRARKSNDEAAPRSSLSRDRILGSSPLRGSGS
jgi:anti-sigma regulatory factor (Ser/Thr protein kinase)